MTIVTRASDVKNLGTGRMMVAGLGRPLLAMAVTLAGFTGCAVTPAGPVPSSSPTQDATVDASPSAAPDLTPTPTPTPTPTVDVGPFDAEAALGIAIDLAQMGTRDAGTSGDLAARRLITSRLRAAGWQVVEQEVLLPQGGSSANVIAVRDLDDLVGPHLVVGGHHDTRGGSPGANDNGTGIGVLLSVAEEVADEQLAVPVAIVAFAAEEYQPSSPRQHHLGSAAYVDVHGDHVLGAFIVDMVGNGATTCLCWFDAGPRTMADRMSAVVEAEGLTGYRMESRGDLSDHGPFARAGIPAAFLWTFDDGVLHTPRDTSDRLVLEDIRRAGDLTLAFLRTLGTADLNGLREAP